jgi:hypothetical protein
MASLVIHSEEPAQAASFTSRALIGRKAFNGVQLGQRIVSRIHAWIDRDDVGFFIRDARSRGGTYVNGKRTDGRVMLHEGDEIRVGTSKITFHESSELPEGAVTFHIAENGSNPEFDDPGILIACEECGAPMWVPASMAGAFGRCAICSAEINVPGEPASGIRRPLTPNDSIVEMPAIREPVDLGDSARPHDPLDAGELPQPKPAAAAKTCGVCQSPLLPGDATTQCTHCSQTYHTECWHENRGCAAYGCPEVGALDVKPEPAAPETAPSSEPAVPENAEEALAAKMGIELPPAASERRFPWDFALLGGSVVGTVIGFFTFGLPALVVGALSTIYAMRQRDGRRLATVSAVICLIGVATGVITSCLWFNVPVPLWRSR